jgi:hypothetical protein
VDELRPAARVADESLTMANRHWDTRPVFLEDGMNEHESIKTSHKELVATIEKAQTLVHRAVEEFFANIAHAEALCEKAKNIAQAWNQGAESSFLPDDFEVRGYIGLGDIKELVKSIDIRTMDTMMTRTPLSLADLAPVSRQRRRAAA